MELVKGRYRARVATTQADIARCQDLRGRAFLDTGAADRDALDAACAHVLIEECGSGDLVGCFRMMHLRSGLEIDRAYSAQFYDLSRLRAFRGPMVEIGRFCVHPARQDADILRVAWGAITAYVDRERVEMLFGCSSFPGTDPAQYDEAFALLHAHHLAPTLWQPAPKVSSVLRFAMPARQDVDRKQALAKMPPLLRTYLVMGGWVSDHAVIDYDLGTLHVFTGLEIKAVPAARARLLRALAG